MPPCNVFSYLLEHSAPGDTALLQQGEVYTHGELRDASLALSLLLRRNGSLPGQRVLLVAENSLFWVAAYLGTLHAGLVSVPLAPSIAPEELRHVLASTAPSFLFADARFSCRHAEALRALPAVLDAAAPHQPLPLLLGSFPEIIARGHEDPGPAAPTDASGLASLMFTSGSTGTPRGVMVTHGNIVANTRSIIEYLRLTACDRMMVVLPFHYCFGTSLLHTHLRVGGSLVLDSRFMYPEVVLEAMRELGCTGFAGVPSHYQLLLRRSALRAKSIPSLRYVQQAGGHLAPSFVSELRSAVAGAEVFVMYGQTEATARLSYLPPELLDTKTGSIGKGIPGVTLHLLDEEGREVEGNGIGEIVAEGENIAAGYWGAPQESAATFRNGRLHTGDLARRDSDGFFYVVGRVKDFIKCGGKRISCRSIEETVLGCESVVEAAAVPVPCPVLGEAVRLFVVPRRAGVPGVEEELREHCRRHLPPALVPREIRLLPSLPRTESGKVRKDWLRDDPGGAPQPEMHLTAAVAGTARLQGV